ncbi:Hsp20/alpha crystallin family protein [Aspergillus undulatus]|uniref:Hsp20/alpha crystallin family protein n=1 Tax=Aspergillus undulatus TaxID=1810928 RepID=UPI003CCE119B
MSLFRTVPTAGDFSPLFRLLDDYDNHRSSRGQNSSISARSFTPRFDVRETNEAYHLDGELPGIPQDKIDIEFTDPQTLVIKGRSEREYHSQSPSNSEDNANTEQSSAENANAAETTDVTTTKKPTKTSKPRYWVSERSVGEFQRTFNFPSRVAQDDVKASLRDGVLSLVVPKAAAPVLRKITIQ